MTLILYFRYITDAPLLMSVEIKTLIHKSTDLQNDSTRLSPSPNPIVINNSTNSSDDSDSFNSPTITPEYIEDISNALAESYDAILPQFNTNPITISGGKTAGCGSFGTVLITHIPRQKEPVAVKCVKLDPKVKNRELQMMRVINHPNCVRMIRYFSNKDERTQQTYLHLVMEYVPHTLYSFNKHYIRQKREMPTSWIKMYSYQLIRALVYLHGFRIAHRDIKPQNILVNPRTGVLKLCDFGSAKVLRPGEVSLSYICSRFYRAPELAFGAQEYNTQIDMWSTGCVIAELLTGRPMFPGDSPVDQIIKIIQILGTPSSEDMVSMRCPNLRVKIPTTRSRDWPTLFPNGTSRSAIDLVSKLLVYNPSRRLTALQALQHPFFDELRDDEDTLLPDGSLFPPFFNFSQEEMVISRGEVSKIWTKHKSRFPQPTFTSSTGSPNTVLHQSFGPNAPPSSRSVRDHSLSISSPTNTNIPQPQTLDPSSEPISAISEPLPSD
ncbi:putative protein kinase [Blattamonas nauphoetae]|uniref:Protein kinase domain-containing protein n=1 Tax=Blattamonas nauphoetae TaxID=2049346 RepID=A0ABQ9Y0E8_9EUKA|nr:putative protein kinase [Blattamonas nauphoetae]